MSSGFPKAQPLRQFWEVGPHAGFADADQMADRTDVRVAIFYLVQLNDFKLAVRVC